LTSFHPHILRKSVKKEQGIIGQEIRMVENNPSRAVSQNLLKSLYKNHPAREINIGSVESISKITAQTLYDCHRVFYNPSNMVLCCSGDFDPESIYKIAAEKITAAAGEVPERDYGEEEGPLPDRVKFEVQMEVASPSLPSAVRFHILTTAGSGQRSSLCPTLPASSLPEMQVSSTRKCIPRGLLTGALP
jgi:predicted Zn-dependent peptidase